MSAPSAQAVATRRTAAIARHLQPRGVSGTLTDDALLREYIRISPAVQSALRSGAPVVALESTIISHGMPWPQNMECALSVEAACTANGAVPATIAILSGVIHVGLESAQLEELARAGENCRKCSRRDLAHVVATKSHGATTVSGTMFVASLVGIPLFVTGGIGGVHRGVEKTMDISADLSELGRTPVSVVCAGVKSILDIPRTLEYLETAGVPVAAWQSDEFPAFFTRRSGCRAPLRVDSAGEVARMIQVGRDLGMTNAGVVLGVPIPACEEAAAEPVAAATNQALKEANDQGVQGRDITPFLLGRINELTRGASLRSNIALILNNVRIGAGIAVELAKLNKKKKADHPCCTPAAIAAAAAAASSSGVTRPSFPSAITTPLVIGGTNQDLLGRPLAGSKFLLGTSNPGTLSRCWGGVGRNVAEVLGRLSCAPILLTAVGQDEQGDAMKRHCQSVGIQTCGVLASPKHATSTYMAILDEKGDLFTTIADMAVCDELDHRQHLPTADQMRTCPLLVLDGNISEQFITSACQLASTSFSSSSPTGAPLPVPVFFEPTSIEKCVRILPALLANRVTYVSPSAAELLAMWERVVPQSVEAGGNHKRDGYEGNHQTAAVEAQCRGILQAIADEAKRTGSKLRPVHILLKRGVLGVMVVSLTGAGSIRVRHLPVLAVERLVNTSGAGDTLVGATCWQLVVSRATHGGDFDAVCRAVQFGMRAAELTLQSERSVAPTITPEALHQRQQRAEAAAVARL